MFTTYVNSIKVWRMYTWWNVIIDWCWGWQLNKGNVVFQGVWVPQRVSPSVVRGDFNPKFVTVSTFAKYIQYLVCSVVSARFYPEHTPQKCFPPVGLTWPPDIVGTQHYVKVGGAINTMSCRQHIILWDQGTSAEPGGKISLKTRKAEFQCQKFLTQHFTNSNGKRQ